MRLRHLIPTLLCVLGAGAGMAQPLRTHTTLKEGWRFMKEGQTEWQSVTVPHDWAIYGPFDRENDIQRVAVVQNGERDPSDKTGRTGGLPYAACPIWARDTTS